VLLSVLAGYRRYAHITALRCDPVNPPLLGMRKVCSEDAVRRGLLKIDEAKGLPWLRNHLDYCTTPLLSEPWVLDMDSTVKTLYGHQEGAEVGYNPHKPGRPSHAYHTYMLSSLRLVLRVDVLPGDEYNVSNATDGLWTLLDHLGPSRRPALLRGDKSWGIERVMARAEQNDLPYLFRLRMTANVRRSLDRAMQQSDWVDAGQGCRARRQRCACRAGAANAGLSCCAATWPATWRSPTAPTLHNRCWASPRSDRTSSFGNTLHWSPRWTAKSSRSGNYTVIGPTPKTCLMN
jgi:hypothetical protein